MKHCSNVITTSHRQRLQALCALSDFPADLSIENLVLLISESPDPETAAREIMEYVDSSSQAIIYKWRQEIADVWSAQNPHVPLLLDIPLATNEVQHAPVLADVHAFMSEVEKQPVQLVDEGGEQLIRSEDLLRLAAALPSMQSMPMFAVESEWGCIPIRRLHVLLRTVRLIRPVKGELKVVRSRYDRFSKWPLMQQLYVLWHTDTYHVSWSEFAGQWSKYVNVLQDYLPLLWDITEDVEEGTGHENRQLCSMVMEFFMPVWEQEGLFLDNDDAFLSVFQQCGLPGVIEKIVINDILLNYGLVVFNEDRQEYVWTKMGMVLMETELNHEFPCGLSLLD